MDRSDGRIGPNAITRIAEAAVELQGPGCARALFDTAGLARYLAAPPQTLVDESEVIALHQAGRRLLGSTGFAPVAVLAGQLTGDYVVANRIPAPARRLLRGMPAWLAGRLLSRAIAAHAWTFVGSGEFLYRSAHGGMRLTIHNSPLTRDAVADQPLCGYYSATFERIFSLLVCPSVRVTEVVCAAQAGGACVFEVVYRPPPGRHA